MDMPRSNHILLAARRLIFPYLVVAGIILLSLGLFVLFFGWERLLADFWPLDNSRIGPNLCASITIVILITAHNEYRTILQDERHHKRFKVIMKNAVTEVFHPAEAAERRIKNDVNRA